jgi:hypothetical protein
MSGTTLETLKETILEHYAETLEDCNGDEKLTLEEIRKSCHDEMTKVYNDYELEEDEEDDTIRECMERRFTSFCHFERERYTEEQFTDELVREMAEYAQKYFIENLGEDPFEDEACYNIPNIVNVYGNVYVLENYKNLVGH